MQRLEVNGAVRPLYGSLGVKRLSNEDCVRYCKPPFRKKKKPRSSKGTNFVFYLLCYRYRQENWFLCG